MPRKSRRRKVLPKIPQRTPEPPKPGVLGMAAQGAAKLATRALDALENDPERAMATVGRTLDTGLHLLDEGARVIREVREATPEKRRNLRNEALSVAATVVKRAFKKRDKEESGDEK